MVFARFLGCLDYTGISSGPDPALSLLSNILVLILTSAIHLRGENMHFPQCKCDQIISCVGNLPRHPTSLRRETRLLDMASRVLLDGSAHSSGHTPLHHSLVLCCSPPGCPLGLLGPHVFFCHEGLLNPSSLPRILLPSTYLSHLSFA